MRSRCTNFIFLAIGLGCWLWLNEAGAQESVYNGAFVHNEGSLTSAADLGVITNFESDSGKTVSIINFFIPWDYSTGPSSFPNATLDSIRAHGSMPLLTWQPNGSGDSSEPDSTFSLSNIITGNFDDYIMTWALASKAWGHPFFLRFAHEMNGNWYPWSESINGNSAGQYVQMWRHVHDIFTYAGVTNVTWVWCVNTDFSGSIPITRLYPGDNYVDWLSLDSYNRLANTWGDFSARSSQSITELTNIAPGKAIIIAETGCSEKAGHDKGQWFRNALTNYLPLVAPRIKAWCYFNNTNEQDGNDWRITTSTNATAGYHDGIGLTYYAGNEYGAISNSPIQPLLNDAMATDKMAPFVSIVHPALSTVETGSRVEFRASASDKSGITKVEFSLNGILQETEHLVPYQYFWTAPTNTGVTNIVTAKAYDGAGNTAISTIQVTSRDAITANLTNSDAVNTSSFNTSGNWDSGQFPIPGDDYIVGPAYTLRTPTDNGAYTFAGDSLTLAGTFSFKQTNVITVADLRLTNAVIGNFFAGGNPDTGRLDGNINVITNATIDAGGNSGATTAMQILAAISGSGGLTFTRPNSVTLSASNTYNGPVTIAGSTLKVDTTASFTPSSLVLLNYYSGGNGFNGVTNIVLPGGYLSVGNGTSSVLRVGYRNSAGTNCVALLDVSSQPLFTANVGEFSVGINQFNDSLTTLGSVYLATNNQVTAANILIGDSAFTGGGTNFMILGRGSNYFNTPVIVVGGRKESAQLKLPAGGSLQLDNGAARADLSIAVQNMNTSVASGGLMDLSAGTFVASIGTLTIGQKSGGGAGGAAGTLTLSSNAANNVNVNVLMVGGLASATSGSPTGQGTLTFGGGNFLVNSNVILASFGGGFGSASGILNINGGTFGVAGDITDGPGGSILNVNGGLVDLKPAGDAGAGSVTVDSLVLNGVITNAFNVTVANFSGAGTIAGQTGVTTVTGSTTPGGSNSLGILTAGALALSGSTVMELNRTNSLNADRLAAGSISFGGALTVTNRGGPLQSGDSFQLFSGTLSGAFTATNLPALSYTNLFWDTSQLNGQGVVRVGVIAAASPTMLPPMLTGTNLTLQVASLMGLNYVLEATPQLAPANWAAVQTNAGGGLLNFMVSVGPGNLQSFFRIRVQ